MSTARVTCTGSGDGQALQRRRDGLAGAVPRWQYPAVIDTATGTVKFDNFEGHWGDQAQLDRLLQMYAVEKAKLEARKKGYTVTEQAVNGGAIKLQIIEGAHA